MRLFGQGGISMTTMIADSAPFIMWGTLIVFNVGIIKLLQVTLRDADLTTALKEKSPQGAPTMTTTTTDVTPPGAPAGEQVLRKEERSEPAAPAEDSSYSRIAGMIGAVVLAVFLWALGNIVLYKCFGAVSEVGEIMQHVGSFFLAGAALFAPYAANKLTSAFKQN
jgi:hypothetical protein